MFIALSSVYVSFCFWSDIVQSQKILSDVVGEVLKNAESKSRIRPLLDEGRTLQVFVSININEITSISESKEEYSLICVLRQTWKDKRLAFHGYNKSIPLNFDEYDRIWTPDLNVRNLKKGSLHQVTVANRQIRLSPDGTVLFSQRLSMTLICKMFLDLFPMDNQTCGIEFESYGYPIEHVRLNWDEESAPVDLIDQIILQEYEITEISYGVCVLRFARTGEFSCLKTYFHFRRRVLAYVMNTYVPSTMVVILSWLAFWIDAGLIPVRTALCATTLLTITARSSALAKSTPSGLTKRANEVWMTTCLVFVLAAFVEFVVVSTLQRRRKKIQKRMSQREPPKPPKPPIPPKPKGPTYIHELREKISKNEEAAEEAEEAAKQKDETSRIEASFIEMKKRFKEEFESDPGKLVEKMSRILFPCFFFLFNLIYWAYYLPQYSSRE